MKSHARFTQERDWATRPDEEVATETLQGKWQRFKQRVRDLVAKTPESIWTKLAPVAFMGLLAVGGYFFRNIDQRVGEQHDMLIRLDQRLQDKNERDSEKLKEAQEQADL